MKKITDFLIMILIAFLFIFGPLIYNGKQADKWNGGWCPECEWTYDFKAVDHWVRYYQCPCCFEEVKLVETHFMNKDFYKYDMEKEAEACQ